MLGRGVSLGVLRSFPLVVSVRNGFSFDGKTTIDLSELEREMEMAYADSFDPGSSLEDSDGIGGDSHKKKTTGIPQKKKLTNYHHPNNESSKSSFKSRRTSHPGNVDPDSWWLPPYPSFKGTPTIVTYTEEIQSAARKEYILYCFDLFKDMIGNGLEGTSKISSLLIKVSLRTGSTEFLDEILGYAVPRGHVHLLQWQKIFNHFVYFERDITLTLKYFEWMKESDVEPDIGICTSVLHLAGVKGMIATTLMMIEEVMIRSERDRERALRSVCGVLISLEQYRSAESLFASLSKEEEKEIVYSEIIKQYTSRELPSYLLQNFKKRFPFELSPIMKEKTESEIKRLSLKNRNREPTKYRFSKVEYKE